MFGDELTVHPCSSLLHLFQYGSSDAFPPHIPRPFLKCCFDTEISTRSRKWYKVTRAAISRLIFCTNYAQREVKILSVFRL